MKIYLIDTIGTETGMNLYDKAFHDEFKEKNILVTILSNYKAEAVRQIFCNFYHGNAFRKIGGLLSSWLRFLAFYLKHYNSVFVYQSFGLRFIDIIFILLFWRRKNLFVVVHDVFEITDNRKGGLKYQLQRWIYLNAIENVICHSELSVKTLNDDVNYKGRILYYPHFRYNFSKDFDKNNLTNEVKNAIKEHKVNLLFFGQIRESKGINILLDAIDLLKEDEKVNFVIAGLDKSGIVGNIRLPSNATAICRYIKDDELNYLFANSQGVLLPYKEIYQSGVLETVVYFQKYAILSNIRVFKEFIGKYPSFGVVYSPNTGAELAECIKRIIGSTFVYEQSDLDRYDKEHDISELKNKMQEIVGIVNL